MKKHFLFSPDDPAGPGAEDEPTPDDSQDDATPPVGDDGPGGQDDLVPRSELNKVSREAAKYRRELRTTQTALKEREDQDKSDLERERDRAVKAEQDLKTERQAARQLRVEVLASRVGIVREARADASRLLDWDQVSDPDDERELESALRDLVKEKPFLLGKVPGGADGGAGAEREGGSGDMNALLRAAAGRT
jgi:hypothetical protein